MSEKCSKYESLFMFGAEEEFAKHLEICEDCLKEHEKMKKTENLVKEVKSYYKNFQKNQLNANLLKIAAAVTILSLTWFSVSHLTMMNEKKANYKLSYRESGSVVAEMGLPTDKYGLLMVY